MLLRLGGLTLYVSEANIKLLARGSGSFPGLSLPLLRAEGNGWERDDMLGIGAAALSPKPTVA